MTAWHNWASWGWLLVGLILYFTLKALSVSSVGSFLIALGVEIAGQVVLGAVARAQRDRARETRRRT